MTIRLPVECRRQDNGASTVVRTITQNVSTGGMYMELDSPDFQAGDRFDIELTIPPAEGVSPYEGRAGCRAEVLRIDDVRPQTGSLPRRYGVAARFLDRLRFSY
jgi:hypothetical protein